MTESYEERQAREAEVRRRLEEIPPGTLFACGWETEPGRVQGARYLRVRGGLVPVGLRRDEYPEVMLRSEVQRSYMHDGQRWGIQILARPVEDTP